MPLLLVWNSEKTGNVTIVLIILIIARTVALFLNREIEADLTHVEVCSKVTVFCPFRNQNSACRQMNFAGPLETENN